MCHASLSVAKIETNFIQPSQMQLTQEKPIGMEHQELQSVSIFPFIRITLVQFL